MPKITDDEIQSAANAEAAVDLIPPMPKAPLLLDKVAQFQSQSLASEVNVASFLAYALGQLIEESTQLHADSEELRIQFPNVSKRLQLLLPVLDTQHKLGKLIGNYSEQLGLVKMDRPSAKRRASRTRRTSNRRRTQPQRPKRKPK